jgi:hypothetical protein
MPPRARRILGVVLACLAIFLGPTVHAQDLTQWTEEGARVTDGEDSTGVLLPNGTVRLYFTSDRSVPGVLGFPILSALSPDGLNFTADTGFRMTGAFGTRVVPLPNGQYRMFYGSDAIPGTSPGSSIPGPGIASAISSDGLNFTTEPNWRVLLSTVNAGPGATLGEGGTVVTLPNGTYRLYFSLSYPPPPPPGLTAGAVFSASSTDMLNWTLDPGVRLGVGSPLGDSALHPDGFVNGDGSVTLFYWTEGMAAIYYATAADGLNFGTPKETSLNDQNPNCGVCFYADPSVYPLPDGRLRIYTNSINLSTNVDTISSAISNEPAPGLPALVSSVLPSSRSVAVGTTATAFATIINAGLGGGFNCSIAPVGALPATFSYQTTKPSTNAVTGSPNAPVTIAAGGSQSFVIALTPSAAIAAGDIQLSFSCQYGAGAPIETGLNTLFFSASTTPTPDVIALVATASNDGTLHIAGNSGTGAFAIATDDVGAAGSITATANTGGATLPLTLTLCETNPATGQCLALPAASVTTTINANDTPTFAIFGQASGSIAFSPAASRIFVHFEDAGGVTRGSTSVAVETQ